jgi:hypothetical protein
VKCCVALKTEMSERIIYQCNRILKYNIILLKIKNTLRFEGKIIALATGRKKSTRRHDTRIAGGRTRYYFRYRNRPIMLIDIT